MAQLNFNATNVKPLVAAVDATMQSGKVWSQYQQGVYTFIETGTGNAVVKAVAGSGKTTTGVESVARIPAALSHIYLAFNKAIAEELKTRGVNARTFHSLCYSPVTRARKVREIDGMKLHKLCNQKLAGDEIAMYANFIVRLVGLGRQSGIGAGLLADTPTNWLDIVEYHDFDLEHDNATMPRALELASKLLEWSNAASSVDFDDLLYFAVRDGLSLPKFDFVFVDEAQDTNAIQRAILRKIMHPTTRIIAIGDPAQAIYGFRGADCDSLDLLAEEFNCKHLPLTVTYRCPVAVVEFAHQWVSHIEAAPNAAQGEVLTLGKWDVKSFVVGDLIVCRTTRPLIMLAYKFLRNRIAARIMGREIGQGLKSLINKQKATDVDTLTDRLQAWAERESEKAIAAKRDAKAESINDQADAIMCLIDGLDETNRTIAALLAVIDELFSDTKGAITLATIHKSKGLEADRVVWLNSSKCPAAWARAPWQQEQERNLCYVAATRAKKTLVLIEEDGMKK